MSFFGTAAPRLGSGSLGRPRIARQAPLWLLAFALVVRLTVLVRRRAADEFASIDSFALLQVGIAALGGLVLLGSPRLPAVLRDLRRPSTLFFPGFYVLGVLSAAWSELPAYSAFRAGEALVQALLVLVALSYAGDAGRAERQVLRAAFAVIALQLAPVLLLGDFTLRAFHSNTFATTGAMVCAYCIGEILARPEALRRGRLLGGGVVAGGLVAISSSSGSNVAVACALTLGALLARRVGLAITIALGSTATFALFSTEGFLPVLFPGKDYSDIAGMGGRMVLWERYADRFRENLFFGEGFAVSARLASLYTTNTHNSFFSALLATGLVGGILYVLGWLGLFCGSVRAAWQGRGGVGVACALTAGVVNSNSKAFLAESWYPSTLVFALFFGLYLAQRREAVDDGEVLSAGRAR
ncbi:MAG: O-antigen ligase family protein [Planctomycetota bacterium]